MRAQNKSPPDVHVNSIHEYFCSHSSLYSLKHEMLTKPKSLVLQTEAGVSLFNQAKEKFSQRTRESSMRSMSGFTILSSAWFATCLLAETPNQGAKLSMDQQLESQYVPTRIDRLRVTKLGSILVVQKDMEPSTPQSFCCRPIMVHPWNPVVDRRPAKDRTGSLERRD